MLQKLVTILYLSGDPLPISTIASILDVKKEEVEKYIDELRVSLKNIGLDLLNNSEGLTITTQTEQAELVEKFWVEDLQGDLTPAALQVLTLVAYLGEPTREQISYIRGVQSSQSIRTLTVRGLIIRNGEVCVLSSNAMKHLGITAVEDLPEYEIIHKNLTEKLQAREI